MRPGDPRPLHALLSQVLVAFTIEFDNQFEQQMSDASYAGARLSLVLWANLMRFLTNGPITVRDLAALALAPANRIKFELGCLERWEFIFLETPNALEPRDGWGSGRGIRASSIVQRTTKGIAASRIWPPLYSTIEHRWESRFGKDVIDGLREALEQIAGKIEMELPEGLPANLESNTPYPPKASRGGASKLSLPALLSPVLLAFRLEFDRESAAPLTLCANTLRVLDREKPIREPELPALTGASPETAGLGWQLKPYVLVARGKGIRLSERGWQAQQDYHRLAAEIEQRWRQRFGAPLISRLRESLEGLFERNGPEGPSPIAEGLVAPPGTVRAGHQAPALGRRDIGSAARQRMRDLVAQNDAFLRDPAAALPHYPLWDMNRGFGP
jgi:hypothetical protein